MTDALPSTVLPATAFNTMGDVDNVIHSGFDSVCPSLFEIQRGAIPLPTQLETRAYNPREAAQFLKSITKEL